ncbi:hypothetical protein, partial [Rhizobium leguminosarum]|uniref:hypothetical protein n=1 Tax=Rhizobium leguminosarum TaxID=384 RepID=UPI001952B809
HDGTAGTILSTFVPKTTTVKWVPTIMNHYHLPDMGRMNLRWPQEGRAGYFATLSTGPRQALSSTALC